MHAACMYMHLCSLTGGVNYVVDMSMYHVTICSVLLYLIVEINIIYNLCTKIFIMRWVKLQRVTKNILLLLDDLNPHRSGAVHYLELEDRRFLLIQFKF